jgi:prepilin-type N-terminal cleavage/methylation domain-containing protein
MPLLKLKIHTPCHPIAYLRYEAPMDLKLNNHHPHRGYSLIELLVVLAILGVLAMVGFTALAPKSPKAVRSGLQDVKASLQQARGLAMSTGKNINVHFVASGTSWRMTAAELLDNGTTEKTPPLMDVNIGGTWSRYATLTWSDPPISGEGSTPAKNLGPLTVLGFSGWATPIKTDTTTCLGFSPQGTPQLVTISSGARLATTGGTWIGVAGLAIKDKGLPYGCVFLLDNGSITAYFKPDALMTDTANQWQRLE